MKTLTKSLSSTNIEIRLEDASMGDLLLENGVYVNQGEELSREMVMFMQQQGIHLEYNPKNFVPRGQITNGVILGANLSYGISPVTYMPINSDSYDNCLSYSVVGLDKATDRQLGLQIHMVEDAPNGQLPSRNNGITVGQEFREVFQNRLLELRDRSVTNSIDALIAGGKVSRDDYYEEDLEAYTSCVEAVDTISKKILGNTTTVLSPTLGFLRRFISTDTQNRTVIIRPKTGQPGQMREEIFLACDVRNAMKKLFQ